MAQHHHRESDIFIKEAEGHQRRYHKIVELTHSTTKAAGVMLLGAIIALIVANTAFHEGFYEFWHTEVTLGFGDAHAEMSLAHIINDILMAIFFLLVGLEIKYEMTVGELTNIRQAILPVGAALGGVMMPIVVYLLFNAGNPDTMMGWGVPTATDIAFALGILALLGSRVPAGVRVFLSTLAVADDIVAILVIAIFYGQSPSLMWLGAALVVLIALIIMNRSHIYSLIPYLLVGAVLWYCIFMSGVHSTIAGVLLAFVIPSGSRVDLKSFANWSGERVKEVHETFTPDEPVIGQADYLASVSRLERVARHVVPPATRLERKLYPWVYFAILPLFALTNADVAFTQTAVGDIVSNSIFLGVFFGLVIGKPLGIMLMSFLIVKTKLSSLPENVNWAHMLGAALLGGVGFTMAIFVANLAFINPDDIMIAKVAILAASLVAGVAGFAFLFIQAKAASLKGLRFEAKLASPDNLQTFGAQEAQRRYERELQYVREQIAKNKAEHKK
ncbi:MAG: Na+/H+ antiporter NhaA [Eggerthellaceae bacterium]|nr:Na+/H+ antiporter NhaA [Eggerthellaceae bacterium]